MKKKTLGRIAIFAFALCMVSTCLLSGTLAKYTTAVEGSGQITVANFTNISFEKSDDSSLTTTFNLSATKTVNGLVKDTTIAPGDTGSFKIALSEADVAYDYTITIGTLATNVPVKFYSDPEMVTEIVGNSLSGSKTVAEAASASSIPIYWKWVTADPDTDNNYKALARTETGITDTFTLNITATQKLATS